MATKKTRTEKGEYLIALPSDYTVIDLETTGFSPKVDEIIEFGAIKIRNGEIVDTFQSLCKPQNDVDEFIERFTGITNEMLSDAPIIDDILGDYIAFIGDDVIVGHNVNFDINFIYDASMNTFGKPLSNDYIDTMHISKRLLPNLEYHALYDIAGHYGVVIRGEHRSVADCQKTFECYKHIKQQIEREYGCIDAFIKETTHKKYPEYVDLKTIVSQKSEFDITHPLYGKYCVFTGALQKYTRIKAAEIVADYGAICENTVTKKTNFLILGDYENCKLLKEGKSAKHKKAEELKLKGQRIEILPESVFYEMIEE